MNHFNQWQSRWQDQNQYGKQGKGGWHQQSYWQRSGCDKGGKKGDGTGEQSKGKGKDGGKGKNPQQAPPNSKFPGNCSKCGRWGHKQNECWREWGDYRWQPPPAGGDGKNNP